MIKSPLNYIGGKRKTVKILIDIFPKKINSFIDLFAGGFTVGINVKAQKVYCNDQLSFLIDMYKSFKESGTDKIFSHIESRIEKFNLSKTNIAGYLEIRNLYNSEKNPLDLFVLIAYSFNHQIRFNNNHLFNNPFGRNRSSFNDTMKNNLRTFLQALKDKDIEFSTFSFEDFNVNNFSTEDFFYCDPPYLITTGTYNDGKRGFGGWNKEKEFSLLRFLDDLDTRNIKFALSNVLEHKGESNEILKNWIKKSNYNIHYIDKDYKNSNYQSKNTHLKTVEVVITNY